MAIYNAVTGKKLTTEDKRMIAVILRRRGCIWETIGNVLGMSRSGAHSLVSYHGNNPIHIETDVEAIRREFNITEAQDQSNLYQVS